MYETGRSLLVFRVCTHMWCEPFQLLFFVLAFLLPAVHFMTVTFFYFLKTLLRVLTKIILSELVSVRGS